MAYIYESNTVIVTDKQYKSRKIVLTLLKANLYKLTYLTLQKTGESET